MVVMVEVVEDERKARSREEEGGSAHASINNTDTVFFRPEWLIPLQVIPFIFPSTFPLHAHSKKFVSYLRIRQLLQPVIILQPPPSPPLLLLLL